MTLSTTNKAAYQHYKSTLILPLRGKNIYDKITRIIIDCDECNTYWQNNFDFFVNIKTIAKKTLPPSFVTSWITLREIVIEIKHITWSCPDPIFFKNKYANPILIRKNRKYPAGYPILILFMLTSDFYMLRNNNRLSTT